MPKIRTSAEANVNEEEMSFNIIEECLKLPERKNGNVVRLDYAAWGNGNPKYELRIWKKKDGVMKPTKGIGLSGEELIMLREMLNRMEEEE